MSQKSTDVIARALDWSHTSQSEESLIKKSYVKSWRSAESKLVQPRIQASKTGLHGKKQRMFQEDESVRCFPEKSGKRLVTHANR